jgi:peptidyl-prolyl cis-trans isomerase SurA
MIFISYTSSSSFKLFLASFLFLANLSAFSVNKTAEKSLDRIVAVVGQSPILRTEIEGRLNLFKKTPLLTNILGIDAKKLSFDFVRDLLIEDRIIEESARDLGVEVSDLEVTNQIQNIAKQNRMSVDQMKKSLAKENIPFDEYKANIRLQILKKNVFERELRRSGGITEQEIRSIYESRAPIEYDLSLIFLSKPAATELATSYAAGKTSIAELKKHSELVSLGWTSSESLKKEISDALKTAEVPALLKSSFQIQGRNALVLVLGKRRGSDEEFETQRAQLTGEAQAVDFQRRFRNWLDKKREDMNIKVNKT